ncbi:MAG: hypothetical protein WCP77_01015 [Roseococcus sp.]
MLSTPHDLSPCLRHGDEVTHLGGMPWTDRTGRTAWAEFYLVLHRAQGGWTHLYRVAPGPRLELTLVRAMKGDARSELRERFFVGGAGS